MRTSDGSAIRTYHRVILFCIGHGYADAAKIYTRLLLRAIFASQSRKMR